jgi:hypothetical protein
MTADQVREILRLESEKAGGQSEWSRQHKVSRFHVSDVIRGHCNPTKSLYEALGLERMVFYVKK